MHKDKGVAGLGILISIITSVFIVGLLVSLFAISNTEFEENLWEETTDSLNETLTNVDNSTGEAVSTNSLRNCADLTLSAVHNTTEAGADISSGNYTISDCTVTAVGGSPYTDENWHIIGTATYDADTTGSLASNDTTDAIAVTITWLPIIIIITAIVVLILLVTLIIGAIKGSGGFIQE